jgi:hypothetical protein
MCPREVLSENHEVLTATFAGEGEFYQILLQQLAAFSSKKGIPSSRLLLSKPRHT